MLVRSAERAVAKQRRDMGSARRRGWCSSQQVTTVGPLELGRCHVSIDLKGGSHGGIWRKSILIKKKNAKALRWEVPHVLEEQKRAVSVTSRAN